ncbi:hypothetical protein [Burkholderia phage FLC9]|nr:hypothetical protein [Burkholderia phage FLC9]
MRVMMSNIMARLMDKAENTGNYQALMFDFGDGRATEVTHPFPVNQNPGGMQRAILINPLDREQGIFKYAIYDRHLSERHPVFGVDDMQLIQFADEQQLNQFIDDVWNHLISAQTQLKWDL